MKHVRLLMMFVSALLISSCGNEVEEKKVEQKMEDQKTQLINLIQRLEGEMHRSRQIDNVLAGQAIKAYDDYACMYPTDSMTADYLFKAGEIATAAKQYLQAIHYYDWIIAKYPKYPLIQESYFLRASVYDHYLNDDIKAEEAYESLLEAYPSGQYTADANAAISNLGKTDAQLHEQFRKKNGEK